MDLKDGSLYALMNGNGMFLMYDYTTNKGLPNITVVDPFQTGININYTLFKVSKVPSHSNTIRLFPFEDSNDEFVFEQQSSGGVIPKTRFPDPSYFDDHEGQWIVTHRGSGAHRWVLRRSLLIKVPSTLLRLILTAPYVATFINCAIGNLRMNTSSSRRVQTTSSGILW